MGTRVYLGHLSRDASDRDIENLFKNYGRLREVTIKNGFGFVEFSDPRDAKDAVYDVHGKDFLGERYVQVQRIRYCLLGYSTTTTAGLPAFLSPLARALA
jgi:hypothetical protein